MILCKSLIKSLEFIVIILCLYSFILIINIVINFKEIKENHAISKIDK